MVWILNLLANHVRRAVQHKIKWNSGMVLSVNSCCRVICSCRCLCRIQFRMCLKLDSVGIATFNFCLTYCQSIIKSTYVRCDGDGRKLILRLNWIVRFTRYAIRSVMAGSCWWNFLQIKLDDWHGKFDSNQNCLETCISLTEKPMIRTNKSIGNIAPRDTMPNCETNQIHHAKIRHLI